jgi:hypothetical protein
MVLDTKDADFLVGAVSHKQYTISQSTSVPLFLIGVAPVNVRTAPRKI